MSGLIWAGLGKGIADAGATFGNAMMRSIEEERKAQLDAIREERLAAREAERLRLKEEADVRKTEREAQERMDIAASASARADEMAVGRDAGLIAGIAGQVKGDSPAASREEIAQLIKDNPQYRDLYRQYGIIEDKVDPRLQRATDEEQAVRELGAKPTFVEVYAKARKDVLAQIAAENKERREGEKSDREARRLDALLGRWESQNKTDQQRADAATTSANRPPASGASGSTREATTADLQRQIENVKDQMLTIVGGKKTDVMDTISMLKRMADRGNADAKSKLERVEPLIQQFSDVSARLQSYKNPASGVGGSSSSGDNAGKRDPGAVRVTSKAEFDKLPRGTRYTAPDGSVRIKQ